MHYNESMKYLDIRINLPQTEALIRRQDFLRRGSGPDRPRAQRVDALIKA